MAAATVDACAICVASFNSDFHRSISLPCGHDFCLLCIVRLNASSKHKCPTCRFDWAGFDVPALPGMEALAAALQTEQDDEGDMSKKKGVLDRCKKHSMPYDYWVTGTTEFFCRRCAVENRQISIELIEDVIPQIREALVDKVPKAEKKIECNLVSLDEMHALFVSKRNSVKEFIKELKVIDDHFQKNIQDIAASRSEVMTSAADVIRTKKKINTIQGPSDISLAVECNAALEEVVKPLTFPSSDLTESLLCNIACIYEEEKSTQNPPSKALFFNALLKSGAKPSSETVQKADELKEGQQWTVDNNNTFYSATNTSKDAARLQHQTANQRMSRRVAIGIDLGTTNSRVGIYQNGNVEIIFNKTGSRITPSCVAFTEQECLIGEAAKAKASSNPKNTIFEAKSLIGRKFTDATVQNDIKQWPFNVIDDNNAPKIKVQYKGEDKIFTPEQISAMVLMEMKMIAENFVGGEVSDAVITVPAYFNDSQRQATIDAGTIAGLNVLSLIDEPTAAAIAYGAKKQITTLRNIMIYDLGIGTFDVTILSITNSAYDVIAVGGDTHLGGGDFDNRLVKHFLDTISRKHKVDLSTNQKAMGRLRRACESAKRNLSSDQEASVDIDCLFDRTDFRASINRSWFENLCSDLFQQTLEHVSTTLNDSGLSKDDINEVVLVGGSTRIPKVQEILQDFFKGKQLNKTINPDEAIAHGAAIKAALLSGDNTVLKYF